MPIKSIFKNLTLAGLLVATTVLAQTPYDEGQKALRDQRWMDAVSHFEQAIETDEEKADAALYWKAYSYFKAGRKNEAERDLRKLERTYPDSRWTSEAQALRVEYQDSEESIERLAADDSGMDEELRLFALSQLMERNPERAVPLVLDLMQNAKSQSVRTDAMFVLGISERPEARQALSDAARNSDDPQTQVDAIHMLGTMDAVEELQTLYPAVQSSEARIAIIEALAIAGDSTVLVQYLETEKDPAVRRAAIHGLAMAGDDESARFMESMYGSATSKEEKVAILESLTMMDDAEDVALKILRTETDPDLQRQAIQVLAIIDSDKASEYFTEHYPEATREEKTAIIESMMIAENSEGLLSLLQQENDPELKRQMVQLLTMMDSDVSDEYLFELLENGD